MTQQITALVTGANRGLGRQLAAELVSRGAKVYAAARRPDTVDLPGVVPIQLDITGHESVLRVAEIAGDVTVLVNNVGVSTRETCCQCQRAVVISRPRRRPAGATSLRGCPPGSPAGATWW